MSEQITIEELHKKLTAEGYVLVKLDELNVLREDRKTMLLLLQKLLPLMAAFGPQVEGQKVDMAPMIMMVQTMMQPGNAEGMEFMDLMNKIAPMLGITREQMEVTGVIEEGAKIIPLQLAEKIEK